MNLPRPVCQEKGGRPNPVYRVSRRPMRRQDKQGLIRVLYGQDTNTSAVRARYENEYCTGTIRKRVLYGHGTNTSAVLARYEYECCTGTNQNEGCTCINQQGPYAPRQIHKEERRNWYEGTLRHYGYIQTVGCLTNRGGGAEPPHEYGTPVLETHA